MPATISSVSGVTPTGRPNLPATVNGTGFGAVQGTTKFLFYPAGGAFVDLSFSVTSWSDTAIVVTIPADAQVGANGFFFILLAGDPAGVRSAPFVIGQPGAATVAALTNLPVFFQPGTLGTPLRG
jgi:hypothetical protein